MLVGASLFASLEEAADAVARYLPDRPQPRNLSGLQKNLRQKEDGRYYWHWDPRFVFRSQRVSRDGESERRVAAARTIGVSTMRCRICYHGRFRMRVANPGMDRSRANSVPRMSLLQELYSPRKPGADTPEIFASLGYGDAALERLRAEGVLS